MHIIPPERLKENLIKKLYSCYIFLGEDPFLIERNQILIVNYAKKQGFLNTSIIEIEKNKDFEKIIFFYKTRNLFFKKTILTINFLIKTINTISIKDISKISSLLNSEILIILKFNHLSLIAQTKKILNIFNNHKNIISCFTPYNVNFINWINYEIKEKKLNIEKKALSLLYQYYEGNTLFIYNILDVLFKKYSDSYITAEKLKINIMNFFEFSASHWIDAILQGKIKKSFYILNIFEKKKYTPLILIRALQKDLSILIHMNREKKININNFLKKNNISNTRHNFFIQFHKKIHDQVYFEAIRILLKIEISIKKKYNYSIWMQLKQLNLILIC